MTPTLQGVSLQDRAPIQVCYFADIVAVKGIRDEHRRRPNVHFVMRTRSLSARRITVDKLLTQGR